MRARPAAGSPLGGLLASLLAGLLASVALAGCGAAGEEPRADPADAAAVTWSPCDGLSARTVGRHAGQRMVEQTGSAAQPRCAFTPAAEGGPAFDVNYLWFAGSLDEAWRAIGGRVQGAVSEIAVPGADGARLVVQAGRSGLLVTGFVQSGGLVQSVNAVQLRPYDERTVVRTTRMLLADLVREAPARP